ncbi:MAG TPA: DUF58 domain-containing protein [Candidatus Fraserbacteria bacterium]|nr:DUF58 domain-containing protein [Candidatus Fraserbacteria bacterium]
MRLKRTGRWWLLVSLALLLVLSGLALRSGHLIALALPLLIVLAAGIYQGLDTRQLRLEVHRSLSRSQLPAGQPASVGLEVLNTGTDLDSVRLRDLTPLGLTVTSGETEHRGALAQTQRCRWEYTVQAERGLFEFGALRVQVQDWLGLTQLELDLPAPGRLAVLPRSVVLDPIAIRPRRTRVYAGTVKARESGAGIEFFGTREYQPGDELRWINWKASARYQALGQAKLISNAFEQERASDVGIVLDARQASYLRDGQGLFEAAIVAAASVASSLLESGNRVALLIYGDFLSWTMPGYGARQQQKILQALTAARPGKSAVFAELDNLPVRLFPAGSQIVILSPLLPDDPPFIEHLRARGYQVLLISPDPISFELPRLELRLPEVQLALRIARLEREATLTRLRRAGVRVANWEIERPLRAALRTALARRWTRWAK